MKGEEEKGRRAEGGDKGGRERGRGKERGGRGGRREGRRDGGREGWRVRMIWKEEEGSHRREGYNKRGDET